MGMPLCTSQYLWKRVFVANGDKYSQCTEQLCKKMGKIVIAINKLYRDIMLINMDETRSSKWISQLDS